jgi:hypothetical protein
MSVPVVGSCLSGRDRVAQGLPSRVFNSIVSSLTDVTLHDHNSMKPTF